ncbi:hypothetical protein BDZ45DRAFT_457341 [Acephala macrosclerotiorum]|nr:hypothetical protein BDZ45DRAFT_457341 [Acephala macrosclerotiorum]
MTRAQRLVKHKETAMRKWEKAMKRGRTEDADLIALKLMKRYANAGEKLDDYLSQQLSLENQKIANLGLSLKKTKMTYLEGESRVPPMEKVDRDESVIIVYDVPRTASGHELIREGDALAFLKAKESEPFLTYNFWVRREYERGNGTVEFPATACVEFRESKE